MVLFAACAGGSSSPVGDGAVADSSSLSGDSAAGDSTAVPSVRSTGTYAVVESPGIKYAEGQKHVKWGGAVASVVDLTLDLYEPQGAPPGRPAIVIIHGGAFQSGDSKKAPLPDYARYFAARGWVAISINYRLASDYGSLPAAWATYVQTKVPSAQQSQAAALYPAARDAKAALRWLYANAAKYRINTDYVTALGGSAGAYLAIVLGVTDPEDFRDEIALASDPTLKTAHQDQSSRVRTIIDHWGGLEHMRILEALDGRSRFDATDAPAHIVHGTNDETVPFTEAEALRDACLSTGVPYAFHRLEGRGHGPWDAKVDGKPLDELAIEFIIKHQALTVQN